MAGKFGSASAWILVDGYNLLTAKVQSLRHKIEAVTEPSHGLGDSAQAHAPTGTVLAELEVGGGFFDTAAASSHDALSGSVPTTPQTAARTVCLGFAGQTVGEPFVGLAGAFSFVYEVLVRLAELTKANALYRVTGQIDRGDIVQPLATKTGDWNTKTLGTVVDYTASANQRTRVITAASVANPTVITSAKHGLTNGQKVLIAGSDSTPTIDGERVATVIDEDTFSVPVNVTVAGTAGTFVCADSPNGGAGYQQVTDCSGFTNFVGKIRDSADDVTYADLVTFADNVSDPYAERATVAGTVDRYLSYDGNVTGTGSITVFAGFARG